MLTAANAVIITIVAATTLSVMIAWHARSRGAWRHYTAGRAVMGLLVIQFVILANAAVSTRVGAYAAKPLVYGGLYIILEGAVLGIGVAILTASRSRRHSSKEDLSMNTHRATPPSTQEAHPWRASLRTAVQIAVPALILFVVAQPIIEDQLNGYLPDAWQAWYGGAAGFVTACGAALSRIMALPAAQRLLELVGLGTGVHKEHGTDGDA